MIHHRLKDGGDVSVHMCHDMRGVLLQLTESSDGMNCPTEQVRVKLSRDEATKIAMELLSYSRKIGTPGKWSELNENTD